MLLGRSMRKCRSACTLVLLTTCAGSCADRRWIARLCACCALWFRGAKAGALCSKGRMQASREPGFTATSDKGDGVGLGTGYT